MEDAPLEFAGQKVYHGGNPANILKRVFRGAVFYFAIGQHWHTNLFFGFCVSAPHRLLTNLRLVCRPGAASLPELFIFTSIFLCMSLKSAVYV